MKNMLKTLSHPPKESPIGTYRVEVISLPEECDWELYLPIEIRYIFARSPGSKEKIRKILMEGKAIGVRTVLRTPENVLKAIHAVSVFSQHNYIITWLPQLLRNKHLPVITEADTLRAEEEGVNLHEAVEIILHDRLRFKRLVLIDEENIGITPEELQLMAEFSEIIYPLAIDYSVFRVIADNASERTEVARSIVKALFIVGPIAHILERYVSGIGKLFAASADDLLGEAAELTALHGSGFSWRELAKRSRILVPVFALATVGALSVEGLLEHGHLVLGGVIFGLSAVALSLTTALQSLFLYRASLKKLMVEKKTEVSISTNMTKIALLQDFTNPARLGLLIGAALAPVMGILGALLGVLHNGWILAAIGSTESIVAGLTVLLSGHINEWRFHRTLKLLVKHS